MNFNAIPMPVSPMITRSAPAITVHMNSPIYAVGRDDARHHHYESPRGAANLGLRSTQRGYQKSGNDGAVNPLESAPRQREGHGQRQRGQPDGYASDEVQQKFVLVVVPQTKDRFGSSPFFLFSAQHTRQKHHRISAQHQVPLGNSILVCGHQPQHRKLRIAQFGFTGD
jgi:hypothetical protein